MSYKTWAYCAKCPEGEVFDAVPDGWVDSPAKIVKKTSKKKATKKRNK